MIRKDITHRIAYFTCKVAEKGSVHPSRKQPRSYKYRNERLLLYKKLLHERIEEIRKEIR
jgi:hypothetical protein